MSNFVQALTRKGKTAVFDLDKILYIESGEVEYFDSAEARLERIKVLTGVDCK